MRTPFGTDPTMQGRLQLFFEVGLRSHDSQNQGGRGGFFSPKPNLRRGFQPDNQALYTMTDLMFNNLVNMNVHLAGRD